MPLIADILESRQSPENPTTSLANPAAWLIDAWGGGKTAAGVRITPNTAVNLASFYSGIRVISDTLSTLPFNTYERQQRGKRLATELPIFTLLHDSPNPEMTSVQWNELIVAHLVLFGNSYWEIVRDNAGRVRELWPLLPDRTEPERDNRGRKFYVTSVDGQDVPIPARRILHIPGWGYDGWKGRSVISLARESLALQTAAQKFGANFFGKGAKASGVLEHPARLGEEARENLRNSWEQMHSGLDNSHRIAILEEGMKWQQLQVSPSDSQFLDTRQFEIEEVARWLRVPPHKLMHLLRATFSNIEHQNIEWHQDGVVPWACRIEKPVMLQLFSVEERAQFYVKYKTQGILRGDNASRATFYKEMFMMGAFSPNDILELEDEDTYPGGDGHFVPLNMIPIEMAAEAAAGGGDTVEDDGGNEIEEEEDDERTLPPQSFLRIEPPLRAKGTAAAFMQERRERFRTLRMRQRQANRPMLLDAAQRLLNIEIQAAHRAVDKHLRDREGFRKWLDEFYSKHAEKVAGRLRPVLETYASAVTIMASIEMNSDRDITNEMTEFITRYVDGVAKRWQIESAAQLRAILEQALDAAADELHRRLDQWKERRAEKFTDRETVRAGEAFARTAYTLFGAASFAWVTQGENCPFCNDMSGRSVGQRDAFLEAGSKINVVDERSLEVKTRIHHPPLHGGCDCFIIPG